MNINEKGRGFVFPFEKLEVWQLAVDLADFVLELLESFPPNKHFRLVGQMEAAVAGIPQNIAEGKGRQYKAEGCLFEVLTLSILFRRRKLFKEQDAKEIRKRAEIIDRKMHGLVNSLRRTS